MSSHLPYPPEPWDLAGAGQITVWRVPADRLPVLPTGVRPLSVRGRALVTTAFVSYSEAGQMAYDELLAAVVVRHGRGVALSITDIWVDSPASRAGGRELWGIPKEMASFRTTGDDARIGRTATLAAEAPPVASATFTPRRAPAVPLPALPGRVVQILEGATVASRIRASGRTRPARASWTFSADGPLAWLRDARPVTSVVASDFAMSFGPRLPG
ncbi:acetoacetate decarboxylase family protein [Nocardioides pacificus]